MMRMCWGCLFGGSEPPKWLVILFSILGMALMIAFTYCLFKRTSF